MCPSGRGLNLLKCQDLSHLFFRCGGAAILSLRSEVSSSGDLTSLMPSSQAAFFLFQDRGGGL